MKHKYVSPEIEIFKFTLAVEVAKASNTNEIGTEENTRTVDDEDFDW